MLERLSELVADRHSDGIEFKNQALEERSEFEAEGRLLEEDHLGRGTETLRACLERSALILPIRREEFQTHSEWTAEEGESRILSLFMQGTRRTPFPLFRKDKWTKGRRSCYYSERREG